MVTRRFSGPLAFAAVMLLVSFAYADAQGAGELGHGHMWGSGWGWMFLGPLMMIAVVAAIVAVVVVLVRWLGGGYAGAGPWWSSFLSSLNPNPRSSSTSRTRWPLFSALAYRSASPS